jgi:antibiotic biosynthesis monooxygenase (ABM) superfamily enzyme
MWIRSAFWIGRPHAGQDAAFATAIDDELVPAMRRFPGVQAVHALWPRRREDGPPAIHCQVIVQFAGDADMQVMLASAERAALRPRVKAAVALFDGAISHIDYEAG